MTCAFQRLKLVLVNFSVTGSARGPMFMEGVDELAMDVFEERL